MHRKTGVVLEVKGLSVGIKRKKRCLPAVRDLSFEMESGEILGIVGESGCGKTLTALSIPGLLPPGVEQTGGTIRFAGQDLGALHPRELSRIRGRDLTMVFQEPAASLNPLQRIGVQIAEPLKLHGEREGALIRRRVLDILENLGLPDPERLVRAYPHQLSGGMCQRVMIALAVINRPRLLIADEPTTALDLSTQTQILDLLGRINRELGTSILFISHDLSVISRFCSRLLVMYAGRLVESGPVEAIFRSPLHEYTRLLLGSIPSRDRRGKPLASIPGRVPALEEQPGGCPFAPRCGSAEGRCEALFPEAAVFDAGKRAASGEHRVHCVLAGRKADRGKEAARGGN
jgi:peptide/nickel transport system ATP-binding protein